MPCRAAVLIGSLAILVAACDSDGTRLRVQGAFTAPTTFGDPAPFVGASLHPATIRFARVPAFFCPLTPPFTAQFSLLIDPRGRADFFVDRIGLRFLDGTGRASPFQLTSGDLFRQFGSTLVPGGTAQTFDFHPRFGCGFASIPAILFIEVELRERSGRTHIRTLSADLR